jgi:hypothetical protein
VRWLSRLTGGSDVEVVIGGAPGSTRAATLKMWADMWPGACGQRSRRYPQ